MGSNDLWKTLNSVNFMDRTILVVDGQIETKLFENEMNLYLYFYLTSHPHSVFTGLISGQILYPLPFLDRDKR